MNQQGAEVRRSALKAERKLWGITLEKLEIIPRGLSSLECESTLRAMSKEVSRRQT